MKSSSLCQLIRLSQKHLNILENCPNHFQQIYLERIPAIVPHEIQEKAEWGKCFHLLMQQRELGLTIDPLLVEDLEMQSSINALLNVTKDIFDRKTKNTKEAEHSRFLELNGYLLNVVYDLLVLTPKTADILDWKTYLQPENTQKLAKNWQTRLYLYVLAETSNYTPEQISFTYWFVKLPQALQKVTLQYNSQLHQENHRDLIYLLSQLDKWLPDYLDRATPFPRCSNCQRNCPIERDVNSTIDSVNSYLNIADIAEVCFDI
jgi:hypothetical protein